MVGGESRLGTKEKIALLQSGKLSAEQNVKDALALIKKKNKEYNIFLYVAEKEALAQAKEVDKKIKSKKAGKLAGLTVGVKAVINVKGMPISCGSKTLENYYGTYDADAVKCIKDQDGIIMGILNCDEFACGISGEKSAFGPTINPAAPERVPGGSSSGSGAAVAAKFCDLTLGSDTGGSIRNPASHCGIVGIKPSYGRVSRYGLCDLSMSLDQIGPLAQDTFGASLLLEVISGYSPSDPSSRDSPVLQYSQVPAPKALRVGLVKEFEALCQNKKIYALIQQAADKLAKKYNTKPQSLSLKYTNLGIQTYYPIVYTEFYSATRKLDGRRFGKKIEESCGEEVLRRILGGRMISEAEHQGAYYRTALKAKNLITKDFEEAFKKVDIIILPVTPQLPHKLGQKLSVEEDYAMDAFTTLANLAGICGASVPAGQIDGVPVGVQILAPALREDLLVGAMRQVEELMGQK